MSYWTDICDLILTFVVPHEVILWMLTALAISVFIIVCLNLCPFASSLPTQCVLLLVKVVLSARVCKAILPNDDVNLVISSAVQLRPCNI